MNLFQLRRDKFLLKAVEQKNLILIAKLLKKGANPNAKDNKDKSLLEIAMNSGSAEVCKILIEAGANPNTKFSGIYSFALLGEFELVQILVKAGGNVNAISVNGDSILMAAVQSGKKEIVDFLLKSGADPEYKNKNNERAVTKSLRLGYIDIAHLLLLESKKTTTLNNDRIALINNSLYLLQHDINELYKRAQLFIQNLSVHSEQETEILVSKIYDWFHEERVESSVNRLLKEVAQLLNDHQSKNLPVPVEIGKRPWRHSSHFRSDGTLDPNPINLMVKYAKEDIGEAVLEIKKVHVVIDELLNSLKLLRK